MSLYSATLTCSDLHVLGPFAELPGGLGTQRCLRNITQPKNNSSRLLIMLK